jgi:RNA polymerase sigma-70 factor (ECF subfamily)
VDELVARARRGDRGALEALFERSLTPIYRFVALKLGSANPEVEDVVQETFIGAMGSISRLRGDDEAALMRWLMSIARFKVADHLRQRYTSRTEELDEGGPAGLGAQVDVESLVADRIRNERLREALAELTPEQEEVLTLRFILGYDIQQVANITGRTPGAVKALQHRGLGTLERRLASERAGLE